jgi:hypothetical protein
MLGHILPRPARDVGGRFSVIVPRPFIFRDYLACLNKHRQIRFLQKKTAGLVARRIGNLKPCSACDAHEVGIPAFFCLIAFTCSTNSSAFFRSSSRASLVASMSAFWRYIKFR